MKCNLDGHLLSGTRVATPRGLRRIDDIAVGDEVFGWDIKRGKREVQRVEAVQRAQAREVRRIAYGTGAVGGVTRSHTVFAVDEGAWLPVESLLAGTRVLVWDSERPHVEEIAQISATEAPTPAFDVFALRVTGPDASYFADGVLVHA